MCGKENNTKWAYCSDKCVLDAKDRATAENKLLHLRVENAQLEKHAFACELEAEGYRPALDWDVSRQIDVTRK